MCDEKSSLNETECEGAVNFIKELTATNDWLQDRGRNKYGGTVARSSLNSGCTTGYLGVLRFNTNVTGRTSASYYRSICKAPGWYFV